MEKATAYLAEQARSGRPYRADCICVHQITCNPEKIGRGNVFATREEAERDSLMQLFDARARGGHSIVNIPEPEPDWQTEEHYQARLRWAFSQKIDALLG